MEMKRVVVTGIGTINPLGNNIQEYWTNLENGVSGCELITSFDTSKFKTKFACMVRILTQITTSTAKRLKSWILTHNLRWWQLKKP